MWPLFTASKALRLKRGWPFARCEGQELESDSEGMRASVRCLALIALASQALAVPAATRSETGHKSRQGPLLFTHSPYTHDPFQLCPLLCPNAWATSGLGAQTRAAMQRSARPTVLALIVSFFVCSCVCPYFCPMLPFAP